MQEVLTFPEISCRRREEADKVGRKEKIDCAIYSAIAAAGKKLLLGGTHLPISIR